MTIFNPGKKFDRGRFWSCARLPLSHERTSCNQQNNTINLNTWLPLSLKLTFSSQNRYQKFSMRTVCLGPCPWGKEGEEVTCLKGKSACPRRPDGFFFKPWIRPVKFDSDSGGCIFFLKDLLYGIRLFMTLAWQIVLLAWGNEMKGCTTGSLLLEFPPQVRNQSHLLIPLSPTDPSQQKIFCCSRERSETQH